jgi:threonine dehydratase
MLAGVTLAEFEQARRRLDGLALRTPLVRMEAPGAAADVYLKLENLQPVGSFKLRGAANRLLSAAPGELRGGVWTASAGNMAYALAWMAQRLGLRCTVIAPHDAPAAKLGPVRALGACVAQVPFDVYQRIQNSRDWHPAAEALGGDDPGLLIHPFADRQVMVGSGALALEILEDLPEVDAILAPYGGGGLGCGIAAAVRLAAPQAKVYACEVDSGAPLAASLRAGVPAQVRYTPSFVSGMGAPFVFAEMWPLAQRLLDGALVVSLEQTAAAIRTLARQQHVIAEGAGAVAVAAALEGLPTFTAGSGRPKVACVVSGGNINPQHLIEVLQGHVPN